VRHVDVAVTVLENAEARWHRSFALVLESPAGATFGNVTSATVTVVDNGDRAVAIMPAPPVVGSGLHLKLGLCECGACDLQSPRHTNFTSSRVHNRALLLGCRSFRYCTTDKERSMPTEIRRLLDIRCSVLT